MSSKNFSKKSEDKEEQQALKEAEIVAELAPNEKTRKEAVQLIVAAEDSSYPITIQEQEKEAVESVLDENKKGYKENSKRRQKRNSKIHQGIRPTAGRNYPSNKGNRIREYRTSKRNSNSNSSTSRKVSVLLYTLDVSQDCDRILW